MTIRHIVAWKLAAEDAETKREHANGIRDGLLALKGVISEILEISVGPDVYGEGNWDVAIVADFADVAAFDASIVHPAHQDVVGYVRSVVSDRVAVDFEL